MDTVTFVMIGQATVVPETTGSRETRIQEVLIEDVEDGLVFEPMIGEDVDEAWRVINIELAWVEERKLYRKAEWGMKRYQRWMVNLMQKELDALHEELSQTAAGKKVLASLQRCYTDQSAELGPLRDEVVREDIPPEAKKAAEKELTEKHLVFRQKFQECFDKATMLEVQVGPHIVDFYFDKLPGGKVSEIFVSQARN